MPSKTEEKWRTNRAKNEFARTVGSFMRTCGGEVLDSFRLKSEPGVRVEVLPGGQFCLSDPSILEKPKPTLELVAKLRPHLLEFHPGWVKEMDEWTARDEAATAAARVEKIKGAIANNLHLPGLKEEIITIARMLEKGEDIRKYCGLEEDEGPAAQRTNAGEA